jgi:hypothetical protein
MRYLFFEARNGKVSVMGYEMGQHDGDLEHITVRASMPASTTTATGTTGTTTGTIGGEIVSIYYGAHEKGEGHWQLPHEFDIVNGTHAVVFAALHTHASYSQCGTLTRKGWRKYLFPHEHTGMGYMWYPDIVVPLMEYTNRTQTGAVDYSDSASPVTEDEKPHLSSFSPSSSSSSLHHLSWNNTMLQYRGLWGKHWQIFGTEYIRSLVDHYWWQHEIAK